MKQSWNQVKQKGKEKANNGGRKVKSETRPFVKEDDRDACPPARLPASAGGRACRKIRVTWPMLGLYLFPSFLMLSCPFGFTWFQFLSLFTYYLYLTFLSEGLFGPLLVAPASEASASRLVTVEQMDLLGALDFFGVKKLSSDCIVANVRAGQGSGVLPVRGVQGHWVYKDVRGARFCFFFFCVVRVPSNGLLT